MNCPGCNNGGTVMLHVDPIECVDCGSTMNVEYWVCNKCNYSFRLINNKFLDGDTITAESIGEAVGELVESLEEDDNLPEDNPHIGSMWDLVNPCVKCGETMTAYNPETSEYECLMCGFVWEVLKHE